MGILTEGSMRFCAVCLFLFAVAGSQRLPAQETASSAVAEAVRLRNAGAFEESIVLLKAHLRSYPSDGDAIRLLAQTQYWVKDFEGARQTYERALKLHPEDVTLRQQYAQMVAETKRQRGWIKVSPAFHHDDQPLDRVDIVGEAGWLLRRYASLALRVSSMQFSLEDSASRNAASALLAFSGSSDSGVRFEGSGGMLHRSFDTENEFVGSGSISLPVSPALRLRGVLERTGYFYTEASLSKSVTINTAGAYFSLNSSRGWLGEIAAQLQQYPDDNSITTAYAWVLAPVLKSPGSTVHVGYSGAFQNARELRFGLEQPVQAVGPASPNYNFAGRYDPYYTPKDLTTHSVVAALTFGKNGSPVLRLNGAYAVIGSENAPQFVPVSLLAPPRTEASLTMVSRDAHPWNARASVDINASGNSSIVLGAETSRTAFYSNVGAFASWTLRF